MKQLSAKCKLKPVFILYFYSNTGDCKDCQKQGYALTALAQKYPLLRIYSFDYHLDVSALQTLINTNDVENKLPALIVDGKAYYGLQMVQDFEKNLPQLASMKAASSSTSTAK